MTAPAVIGEVWSGDDWTPFGTVAPTDPPGSISSDGPAGRQVYLFGWLENEPAGVWRSVGGVDAETPAVRLVTSVGFDRLSDLSEPFVLDFMRGGSHRRARFRLEAS